MFSPNWLSQRENLFLFNEIAEASGFFYAWNVYTTLKTSKKIIFLTIYLNN